MGHACVVPRPLMVTKFCRPRPLTIFDTATARVWLSIGERTELGMLSPCFSLHQTVTRRFWGYEVAKTNSLLVHEVNSDGFRATP